MPTRLNSTTDIYRLNEADVLGNSKDDTTSGNAGRIPQVNPDIGNATTIVAVDGNLSSITVGTTDPLANTSGISSTKWSIAALMRWLISEVRRTATIGATAANQIDATTTGNITAADVGSTPNTVSATGQTIVTGTPTANSFVSAALNACSTIQVQLAGAFVGTLIFERSIDGGTTWNPTSLVIAGVGSTVSSATTIGSFRGNVAGATNFRVRCTAFASGSIAVTIVSGKGVENVFVSNGVKAAYTLSTVSGTCSVTPGTKTQVVPINTNRQQITIENRSSTDTLTVWKGASAAEVDVPLGVLTPSSSAPYQVFQSSSTDRYAISSSGVSTAYTAQEGVYS